MAQHGRLLFFHVCLCFVLGACAPHECDRQCLDNELPKKCYYHFTIGVSQGDDRKNLNKRSGLSINGKSPGPMISVCQDDIVIVEVKNHLPYGMETSLHWHGLSEGISPFMDGVPMITQCPIPPHTSFTYNIKAAKPGTYYYHAHSVAQQLDGVYGPFIISTQKSQIYPDNTVIVSPQMKNLQTLETSFEADLNVTALKVYVYERFANEDDEKGGQRLRIINAAALDCPIRLFTHIIPLKVVAVDGNDVKPKGVNEVVISPGERVDLLIKSEVMKVTHIVGYNLCKGHAKYGFDPGISDRTHSNTEDNISRENELVEKLESDKSEKLEKSDVTIFVPFDVTVYDDFKGTVDFRYKLGALTPYAPSLLSKNPTSLLQVNNISFLYPSSPILSQPESVPETIICDLENPSERCMLDENGFCECLQIINVPYNKNVDLFLIDEGKNSNTSNTVHVHGHSFFVLSVKSFDEAIQEEEIKRKDASGEINRNLVNPIKKDTIVVPNKGFVILRLITNNPGMWLLESATSKARTGSGLELVLNVKDENEDLRPPGNFPVCGTMKEPDLVFSND